MAISISSDPEAMKQGIKELKQVRFEGLPKLLDSIEARGHWSGKLRVFEWGGRHFVHKRYGLGDNNFPMTKQEAEILCRDTLTYYDDVVSAGLNVAIVRAAHITVVPNEVEKRLSDEERRIGARYFVGMTQELVGDGVTVADAFTDAKIPAERLLEFHEAMLRVAHTAANTRSGRYMPQNQFDVPLVLDLKPQNFVLAEAKRMPDKGLAFSDDMTLVYIDLFVPSPRGPDGVITTYRDVPRLYTRQDFDRIYYTLGNKGGAYVKPLLECAGIRPELRGRLEAQTLSFVEASEPREVADAVRKEIESGYPVYRSKAGKNELKRLHEVFSKR